MEVCEIYELILLGLETTQELEDDVEFVLERFAHGLLFLVGELHLHLFEYVFHCEYD